MSDVRAVDMPEIRAELIAWFGQHGVSYFTACLQDGAQHSYRPDLSDAAEGARLALAEQRRLMQSDLFWVSREMTELCVTAARTMPAWELQPEDLIAPAGLIYFEGLPDFRPGRPASAFTWSRCPADVVASTGLKGPGIWLSGYAERSHVAKSGISVPALFPRLLVYDGESIAAFGQHEEGDVSYHANDDGDVVPVDDKYLIAGAGSLAVFKAACLLMRQEFASGSAIEPNSASRKRIRRLQQEAKPVRVIKLRHASTAGTGTSDREYHHQWIVRGHWRQQWYPSREVHRPVWIAPHVKGPEGAPLLGGEKVHAWVR